ncbi:MAG: sulfotransferase [Candidatus Aminicenantes bacterium]|nr:sulfotransferase [Candidatus Aminicenantes bacterium]
MNIDKKKKEELAPLVLQNGIFVAGHPRSGTSLACQLLESAGVCFPSDLSADIYNKDGYYELAIAKELEKKLLDEAMTDANIVELNKVIKTLNDEKGLTGLKIVHIPALFFYRHIAKKIRAVFIFRNPADVKSSMFRRGISQFKLSWFENNNALIAAHENIPKSIVISYDSLIQGKEGIKKAFMKMGFKVDLEKIKREHQTQKNSKIIITHEEMRLYKYLKKLEKASFN